MLELGKPGSAGTEKGVLPVLHDGSVVATLRASSWKEAGALTVEPELPVHHQVLLLWLELVIDRRNSAALTAATGAAVVEGSR